MPLVVTGSIGIDTVHTPSGSAEEVLGGSCVYFAAGAGFFAPVRLVAAVGDDFDERHMNTLNAFPNVDLSGLERRAGSKTFRWTGRYLDNMNDRETIEVHLGVLGERPAPAPDSFRDSEFLFLANTDPVTQLEFLESFPNRRLAVADTMDLWIQTKRDELNSLLDHIDGLILNDSEAELLTEDPNAVRAARTIRERHDLGFVLVKKGEHGSILFHRRGMAALPAYPVERVIDPTGAGDSFAGGLMGYLAAVGRTDFEAIQAAMTHGTVISSFTIEAFSLDRLRQIGEAEIHKRMIEFARAVRVI
ncbi:MAG: PfkB family carbohydrate kinase [Phycisphaerales bacterium]